MQVRMKRGGSLGTSFRLPAILLTFRPDALALLMKKNYCMHIIGFTNGCVLSTGGSFQLLHHSTLHCQVQVIQPLH